MLLAAWSSPQPPDFILCQSVENGAIGLNFSLLIKTSVVHFPFGIQLLFSGLLTCCFKSLFTEFPGVTFISWVVLFSFNKHEEKPRNTFMGRNPMRAIVGGTVEGTKPAVCL